MNSRSASEWLKAYGGVHQELTSKGFKPKLQTLENEASTELKSYFKEDDVEDQLVPPHCHRHNVAENVIRTFKDNFGLGMASAYHDFPLHLWDRILPQAEITLDLLRTSRQHPQLSAAAHFHGMIDYNKTAFAPPGCKISAHEKPPQRRTWAPHGQLGCSLVPAMHHYRCQKNYISSTASKRIVDTLDFAPHNSPMPQIYSMDRLLMATNDMNDASKHPHPYVPFTKIGDDTITVLSQLATIFKNKFQKPSAPEIIQSPIKAAENKQPSALIQPILTSPMNHNYQTRSQSHRINTSQHPQPTPLSLKTRHYFRGWSHQR
jgi:hypothetical protein